MSDRFVIAVAVAWFVGIASAGAAPPGSPYLKPLADDHGVRLGVAVKAASMASDAAYRGFVLSSFHVLKPEYEMKANTIRTDSGGWNFGPADAVVDRAKENGRKVHGHALVWYKHGPRWVANKNATTVEAAMNDHIETVVNRYKHWEGVNNVTVAWDVVNEALRDSPNNNWPGSWLDKWLRRVGDGNDWSHVPDYIGKAFHKANALHGSADLIYNDYGIEQDDPANPNEKSDATYALMQDLLSRGVPVDGIGFQCHFTTSNPLSLARLAGNLKRFADLGLKVYITELDARVAQGQDTAQERQKQKDIYWGVIQTALLQPACQDIQFWSLSDAYASNEGMYEDRYPGLLDDNLTAKPAYWAVRDLFDNGVFPGTYRIVNRNSGMAVHVDGGSMNPGALLVQYPYNGWGSQKWTFELTTDRLYVIRNVQSGLRAHVQAGASSLGAALDQDPSWGKWRIAYDGEDGGRLYRLIPSQATNNDRWMHVYNGSTAPFAGLDLWNSTTPPSQWRIEPVD